jgi:probable HAF family extracellular repeat protein
MGLTMMSRTEPCRRHPAWRWLGARSGTWRVSGLVVIAIAAASPATAAAKASTPSGYAVTILGTLSNLSSSASAAGINDLGWIVGAANYPQTWTDGNNSYPPNTTEHATVWRNGQITDLGTLGGPNSSTGFVARPNRTGLISGNAQNDQVDPNGENWGVNFGCDTNDDPCEGWQYEFRAFAWRDGAMHPLPTLGGNNAAGFGGANDEGQMAGMAETAGIDSSCQTSQFVDNLTGQTITLSQVLDWKPVVWGPIYSEVHELPVWPGDTVGLATAINDQGQVVGGSGFCTTPAFGSVEHALLWQDGRTINLGSLGGTYDNLATAINDRGQIIGWSDTCATPSPSGCQSDGPTHSFLWQHGVMTDLGTLPGLTSEQLPYVSATAYGINNAGQVIGNSCDAKGTCDAFLWQNGTMTDLNNAVEHLTSCPPMIEHCTPGLFPIFDVSGINSQGEIVGSVIDNDRGSQFYDDLLAFSEVPCDSSPATERSCSQTAHGTTTTAGPSIVTPHTDLVPDPSRMRLGFFAGLP